MNSPKLRRQLNDIDLRLLRIFMAVAEFGGFAAAEIELNISRSTISTHIADLEDRLGMKLCLRSRGRSDFSLTPQGEELCRASKEMLEYLDVYRSEIHAIQSQMTGRLRIALPDDWLEMSRACFDLAPVISRFKEAAPKVELQIVTRAPMEVDFEILNGKADLGINTVHIRRPGLEYFPIFEHSSFLYCTEAHPLYVRSDTEITQDELMKYELVATSYKVQSSTHSLVSLFDQRATADHMEGCLLLMLSGKYLGFLPDYFAKAMAEKYPLKRLLPETFHYQAENSVICKRGARNSAAVGQMVEYLQEVMVARHV